MVFKNAATIEEWQTYLSKLYHRRDRAKHRPLYKVFGLYPMHLHLPEKWERDNWAMRFKDEEALMAYEQKLSASKENA